MVTRRPSTRKAREEVQEQKDRLRAALGRSGLGQNEVARAVGASQSVASKWFDPRGDTLPGGKFVGRLTRVFRGTNGHWLWTGEGHWYTVPTSGRRDIVFAQGFEAGARDAMALMRRALLEIQANVDRLADEVGAPVRSSPNERSDPEEPAKGDQT